ncbi:MAG: DUF2063 domain-containing protein, partial [Alphaproteobacteria bacterium]
MSGLKDLQETFQRALCEGDDTILADLVDSPRECRETLLGVYRNAYVVRLREILAADYDKVAAMLGDDQFERMAQD